MKRIGSLTASLVIVCFISARSQTTHLLEATVYGNPADTSNSYVTGFSIDGSLVEYGGCGAVPSIHLAIIDSVSCIPVNNCNSNFGQSNLYIDPNLDCITDPNTIYTCRARAENYFYFRSNISTQIQSLGYLLDSIGAGHYLLLYTFFPSAYTTMDTAFTNSLQRLGSTLVTALPDSFPFVFFCRKGDTGSVVEAMGSAWDDSIFFQATFQCAPSGISENNAELINIFPNPTSDRLFISLPDHVNGDAIKIRDALGREVCEITTQRDLTEVDTRMFAPGVYFVQLAANNLMLTRRFLISD